MSAIVAVQPDGMQRLRDWLMQGERLEWLIVALAAIVRFWRLAYHSIWFDEAVSLRWAGSDIPFIWQKTFPLVEEKHPPAYYILLHGWQRMLELFGLGQSDAWLRASGSLLGVLTVVGMLLLVRRLSGRRVALLTGLLVALAPVLIWYSQELRMFQPATTALVWAGYALLRAWESGASQPGAASVAAAAAAEAGGIARFGGTAAEAAATNSRARLGWWALMVAAFVLALYSYLFSALMLPAAGLTLIALWAAAPHVTFARNRRLLEGIVAFMAGVLLLVLYSYLFSEFVLPAVGIILIALWARKQRGFAARNRRLLEGVGAFAVVTLLFLPLARNAWLVNASENTPGAPFADVGATTLHLLRVFSVWKPGWPEWLLTAVALLTGALLLLGVLLPRHRGAQPGVSVVDRIWIALWVSVPWLVGNLLLATTDSVFGDDRYFLFLAPFVLWGAARGAVALGERWRPAGWATGGALVLALTLALPVLWTPAMFRENWRAAARLIAQQRAASPGLSAAVLSHVDYTRLPAEWYLKQYPLDLPIFYPFGGALDPAQVETQVAPPLEGLAAAYDSLWLLQSHLEGVDDNHLVEQWLAARFPLITEAYPAGIRLTGYALQSRFAELPLLQPDAILPNVEAAPGLALVACEALGSQVVAQDDALHPPSGWLPVRLWWQQSGAIAQDYVARVRLVNEAGVWGESLGREGDALRRMPTSQWDDDAVVRNEVDVNLNPATPPGHYQITVRVLDGSGAEAGPEVGCGSVEVSEK